MPSRSRRLLVSIAIVLLHLPLIQYTRTLIETLRPGEGLVDVVPGSLGVLLALFLLPPVALKLAGIRWNPARSRLNESFD